MEGALISRGWPILKIRRWATVGGAVAWSALLGGFACTRNVPLAAALYIAAFVAYGAHKSGYAANFLEVGGKDTATLMAMVRPKRLLLLLGKAAVRAQKCRVGANM